MRSSIGTPRQSQTSSLVRKNSPRCDRGGEPLVATHSRPTASHPNCLGVSGRAREGLSCATQKVEHGSSPSDQLRIPSTIAAEDRHNVAEKGHSFSKWRESWAVPPAAIAYALRNQLGTTHQATKIVMGWTGAGERTVKNWLAGISGPQRPTSGRSDPAFRRRTGVDPGRTSANCGRAKAR
jgi:hypothetical protein